MAAKQKLKVKWRIAGPALACVILVFYLIISLIVSLFTTKKTYELNNTIGDLDGTQTYQVIVAENKDNPLLVKDYNFYGESLNLYFENYAFPAASSTTLAGSTILLKDLLSDKEIKFENISSSIDKQIDLSQLEEGFYSVYRVNKETTQRLYYNGKLAADNKFTCVSRNGYNYKITMIADKEFFDEVEKDEKTESTLDKNYLYFKVEKVKSESVSQYDIAIQSAPALLQEGVSLEGETMYGLSEGEEMYNIALELQTILEQKGLKVKVLKDEYDEDVQFFGMSSTLERAYDCGAKYLINLDMLANYTDNESISMTCDYSYYASNELAQILAKSLYLKTSIFADENCSWQDNIYDDDFSDQDYVIRESGGRILNAGTIGANSQRNASFAANNKYGINTVSIYLASFANSKSIDKYNDSKDLIASAIAEGICEYLKIAN